MHGPVTLITVVFNCLLMFSVPLIILGYSNCQIVLLKMKLNVEINLIHFYKEVLSFCRFWGRSNYLSYVCQLCFKRCWISVVVKCATNRVVFPKRSQRLWVQLSLGCWLLVGPTSALGTGVTQYLLTIGDFHCTLLL